MDATTRQFITDELYTLSDIATHYGISIFAARKRAERYGIDYVLKAGIRLYSRKDLPKFIDPRKEPSVVIETVPAQTA